MSGWLSLAWSESNEDHSSTEPQTSHSALVSFTAVPLNRFDSSCHVQELLHRIALFGVQNHWSTAECGSCIFMFRRWYPGREHLRTLLSQKCSGDLQGTSPSLDGKLRLKDMYLWICCAAQPESGLSLWSNSSAWACFRPCGSADPDTDRNRPAAGTRKQAFPDLQWSLQFCGWDRRTESVALAWCPPS